MYRDIRDRDKRSKSVRSGKSAGTRARRALALIVVLLSLLFALSISTALAADTDDATAPDAVSEGATLSAQADGTTDPAPSWLATAKGATNLNANLDSTVTVKFPMAEAQSSSDVVLVIDKSSSGNTATMRAAMKQMIADLAAIPSAETQIKVGIVIMNYSASVKSELVPLTADNITALNTILDTDYHGGSNTYTGLIKADQMLTADTAVSDDNKFVVYVSDGLSYYWSDASGMTPKSIYVQEGEGAGTYLQEEDNFRATIPSYSDVKNNTVVVNGNAIDLSSDAYDLASSSAHVYNLDPGTFDPSLTLTSENVNTRPTNFERSIYLSAQEYQAVAAKYQCMDVYWQDTGLPSYAIGYGYMKDMGTVGIAGYDITGGDVSIINNAFQSIKDEIVYYADNGSTLVDSMGAGTDESGNAYDFDFVADASRISLSFGGAAVASTDLSSGTLEAGETFRLGFGTPIDGEYPYVLHYYPNGYGSSTQDTIVLEFNVPMQRINQVKLAYDVHLKNPETASGIYGIYDQYGAHSYTGLYTNSSAELYPVNTEGAALDPVALPRPTVSYSVVAFNKVWSDKSDAAGKRPLSITLNLQTANGTAVDGYAPVWTKDGNTWTASYYGLPQYDAEGTWIVYAATEAAVSGYDAIYSNTGEYSAETAKVYTDGTITNVYDSTVNPAGGNTTPGGQTGTNVTTSTTTTTSSASALPNTGDRSGIFLMGAIGALLVVSIAALLVRRTSCRDVSARHPR